VVEDAGRVVDNDHSGFLGKFLQTSSTHLEDWSEEDLSLLDSEIRKQSKRAEISMLQSEDEHMYFQIDDFFLQSVMR